MSEIETEIKQSEGLLIALAEGLREHHGQSEEFWQQLVSSCYDFKQDIKIPRLDLANEFLCLYCEPLQLVARLKLSKNIDYPTFRSHPENNNVLSIESLADALLKNSSLVKLLGKHLMDKAVMRLSPNAFYRSIPKSKNPDSYTLADYLYHETVESEKELLLVKQLIGMEGIEPKLLNHTNIASRHLQELMLAQADTDDLKALTQWFRNYRRATLNYSWLSSQANTDTPVNYLLKLMKTRTQSILQWGSHPSNDPEYSNLNIGDLGNIWESLDDLFSQIDFDDIIEGLKDGFLPIDIRGRGDINIIPSEDGKSVCKPVLLAFSRTSGKRGKFSFDKVMDEVKQHLIECQDLVKLVIVVSDTWDSKKFMADHYGQLSAWRKTDDVRFLFLMVGAPRNQIAPISVDLT
ncbi:MAG: hypothetical protein L3J39_07785 [Verrucomicrobiales bacterium]|nr:hypothetical protein [Verrucomicrobiales bacterium]